MRGDPELHAIIQNEKNKINEQWMYAIKQIGSLGIEKTALLDLESGKLTGPNTTLYMDEELVNQIEFVQEGSFVETGGHPALKVVGNVQTVVGAQRVIVAQDRNRAINADDIMKCFIAHDNVNNPMEFVKQICYSTTGNFPVYYYFSLAGITKDAGLAFLEEIPIHSSAKDLLKRRIINTETKYCALSEANSSAAVRKREYLRDILEEHLTIPSDVADLKYCLSAIRGMSPENILAHKEYLLNICYDIYSNYFNNADYSAIKPDFRYALCWLDEALYMHDEQ